MNAIRSRSLARGARIAGVASLLLWVIALALLVAVVQSVTYKVCDHSLLHLALPSIHWPPQGDNLGLITAQHQVTLVAVGASVVAIFLILYTTPERGVMSRLFQLVAGIGCSLAAGGFLWVVVEHHILSAQVDALARCL